MNKIAGYKAWTEFVEANSSKTIYALFSGGKDAATGKSWCPDCVTAEPVSFPYNNSQSCKKGPKLDCVVCEIANPFQKSNCIVCEIAKTAIYPIAKVAKIASRNLRFLRKL